MVAPYLIACLLSPGPAPLAAPADSVRRPALLFYGGIQLARLRFSGFGQVDADGRPLSYNRLMPVVGFRFSQRFALEISGVRRRPADGPTTVVDYLNGGLYRYYDRYESYAVPVLCRFRVGPDARRWNLEGVVGISVVHSYIEGRRSMTEAGQPLQPFQVAGFTEANDLPLALGAALTYSPAQHWTVVGEGRLNWSWLGSAAGAAFFGGVFRPQTGVSVGVRYNFNLPFLR